MATRVTLTPTSSDPGALTRVAKTKLPNDRGDREAEAAWLERAARPGVVPLVEVSSPATGEPFTIVTEHVGSRTLRTARLDPLEAWRAAVDIAEVLAGLHDDGLVHGKLTVDHVIVGADRVWLCSPDGGCDDPSEDLDGLARCMRHLQRQWEEQGHGAPFAADWADLAQRFADTADPSRSSIRAVHALRRLHPRPSHGTGPGGDPPAPRTVRRVLASARGRSGIITTSVAIALAIGALPLLGEGAEPVSAGGPRIEVDDAVYAVGAEGDDVAVLDDPCEPSTSVVVLEARTQTIWVFDRVADGAIARPVAVVPGATDVRAEWVDDDGPCTVVVARGPAGASIIDTGPTS